MRNNGRSESAREEDERIPPSKTNLEVQSNVAPNSWETRYEFVGFGENAAEPINSFPFQDAVNRKGALYSRIDV